MKRTFAILNIRKPQETQSNPGQLQLLHHIMKPSKAVAFSLVTILSITDALVPAPPIHSKVRQSNAKILTTTNFQTTLPSFSNKEYIQTRQRTKMSMSAPAAATGAAAFMGVVSGGIIGGALHAIAGKFTIARGPKALFLHHFLFDA